jgi:hypothetical protein
VPVVQTLLVPTKWTEEILNGGLREQDRHILLQHPNLLGLGPPADQVFLMRLSASRAPDPNDVVAFWPLRNFADTTQSRL